jgi:hypothetical protein
MSGRNPMTAVPTGPVLFESLRYLALTHRLQFAHDRPLLQHHRHRLDREANVNFIAIQRPSIPAKRGCPEFPDVSALRPEISSHQFLK